MRIPLRLLALAATHIILRDVLSLYTTLHFAPLLPSGALFPTSSVRVYPRALLVFYAPQRSQGMRLTSDVTPAPSHETKFGLCETLANLITSTWPG